MTSVRMLAEHCLKKTGPLSIRRDVLGVHGDDNAQDRSLKQRVQLIRDNPFVRVTIVSIEDRSGATGSIVAGQGQELQRDLDDANDIYRTSCGLWIYCMASTTSDQPHLLDLHQNDCRSGGNFPIFGHSPSDEELELYDLGRNLGSAIVAYYVGSTNLTSAGGSVAGCAAHPMGRKGFWLLRNSTRYAFAHELCHVMAFSGQHSDDESNLMHNDNGRWHISPPSLDSSDCDKLLADDDVERCHA